MLKGLLQVALAFLLVLCVVGVSIQSSALADGGCTPGATYADGGVFAPGVSVSVTCGGSGGAEVGTGGDTGGGAEPLDCVSAKGVAIPCVIDDYPYQPTLDMYCQVVDQSHKYGADSPKALWGQCRVQVEGSTFAKNVWKPMGPLPKAAEGLARQAVETLTLHPASVHIGAWERDKWPGYGRTWWVGAPVWLWIDTSDPLVWGAHVVSASESGVSVEATVRATHVVFDTGDGESVECMGPGTPRVYDEESLISEHSPTKCDHTYMHTSVLGDPESRYVISASVIWRADWVASNGEKGAFTLTVPGAGTESVHVGELRVVTR